MKIRRNKTWLLFSMGPNHGKLENEEKRKRELFWLWAVYGTGSQFGFQGIFMDIWSWSKAEVMTPSLFLCFWLERTEERRQILFPFLAKGVEDEIFLETWGLLTESNNVNFIVIFPSSPERKDLLSLQIFKCLLGSFSQQS